MEGNEAEDPAAGLIEEDGAASPNTLVRNIDRPCPGSFCASLANELGLYAPMLIRAWSSYSNSR